MRNYTIKSSSWLPNGFISCINTIYSDQKMYLWLMHQEFCCQCRKRAFAVFLLILCIGAVGSTIGQVGNAMAQSGRDPQIESLPERAEPFVPLKNPFLKKDGTDWQDKDRKNSRFSDDSLCENSTSQKERLKKCGKSEK